MANNNVRFFKVAKLQTYLDLAVKDANSLYWVDETQSLYLADKLYGVGQIATEEFAGLLSAEDYKKLQELVLAVGAVEDNLSKVEKKLDAIPDVYVAKKYEITNVPTGTLVDYGEKEIRIMCPSDAKFVKQQVGNGGNANMYYMTFTTYAPDGAVTFKEGDKGTIIDEVLDFETTAGTGVDEYGRKYKHHWFALALYDEPSDTWTYFGKNSSVNRYIGWDYVVEWYDVNGVKFATDAIRINLSNESCHNNSMPYYMNNYVTAEEIADLQASFTWTEF